MTDRAFNDVAAVAPQTGIEADLIRAVDFSQLQPAPFDHICIDGTFSPEQYQEMLDNLPDSRLYHQLSHQDAMAADGSSTRLRLFLYPENLQRLPANQRKVWLRVSQILLSRGLQDAFKRKFRSALEKRFGQSIDGLNFYPIPILVRDLPGYRIGVHTDTPKKAITVQFYLPHDTSQEHLGTTFHESNVGPGFERTKTMKFLPASGYAFPVNREASWHSVVGTTKADGTRNSVMLTYYVQSDPRNWVKLRAQRLSTFFGSPPKG